LLAEGLVDGIRLDHPDGLLNPVQYFTRVQMLYVASQCCGPEPTAPVAENGIENEIQDLFGQYDWSGKKPPVYCLVEKILEPGEHLPRNWPVDGTVGYDFTNLVNGIFIDQRNERFFTNLYRRVSGSNSEVESLVYESKRLIMRTSLSSEVTVLTHLLEEIASTDRHARDFTRPALTDCIREVIACFPVYRTYIDERGNVSERDRAYISEAVARAKRRNPGTTGAIFDFLKNILLLNSPDDSHIEAYRNRLHFTLKFQQLTGPVMAKGLEDTVCYVYNRFISVNEVGGSPAVFGVSVDDFHAGNIERARHWPNSMLATSTHDTKRSEDVRARLNVLSEMPRPWAAQAIRWRRINRARKRALPDGRLVPDANEEYLLYQTLVGAWPLQMNSKGEREEFIGRMKAYMNKAVHEAKVNLSWVNQDPEYVQALEQFIERILRPGIASRPNLFLRQIENFAPTVAFFGAINSIAQTLLKITVPGVPDIYEGTELWELSLVDPDNRRPVDFALRSRMLEDLKRAAANEQLPALCQEFLSHFHDGRLKLWTVMHALNYRREHADLFQNGSYIPLHGTGDAKDHLVAFARERSGESVVVAAPRLTYTL
jgi:(1->4)-alpha-D-glucan 1-alpha-D-glucosylmutase